MAVTYNCIATTTTTTSGITNIDFTNIPGTYTDLLIIATGKVSADDISLRLRMGPRTDTGNMDATSTYSVTNVYGNSTVDTGIGGASERDANADNMIIGRWGNTNISTAIININNYANTSINKSVIIETSSFTTTGSVRATAGLWRRTNAMTMFSLLSHFGTTYTFNSGVTVSVYGIKAA